MRDNTDNQGGGDTCGFFAKCRLCALCRSVFWEADTTTIRMVMGLSSFIWALTLFIKPETVLRHPYTLFTSVAPAYCWAIMFIIHSFAVLWRILDPKPRILWALAVNVIGLALWSISTLYINLAAGQFVPGTAMEIVVCLFSVWVLFRTGLGKETTTP